jgi:hypothetical protein
MNSRSAMKELKPNMSVVPSGPIISAVTSTATIIHPAFVRAFKFATVTFAESVTAFFARTKPINEATMSHPNVSPSLKTGAKLQRRGVWSCRQHVRQGGVVTRQQE